jgi:hypothetical protein
MGRACSTYEEKMTCIQVLMEKPKERRTLGRPRCRGEDNIEMDLRKVGIGGMDWIDLAHDRDR